MRAGRARVPTRGAAVFTRAVLIALPVGLGWIAGTAFRARTAVRTIPVPALAVLDKHGVGIRFAASDRDTSGTGTGSAVSPAARRVPVLRIFGDYECASCQRLELIAGDSLRSMAGSGLLEVVYHHAPLRTHRRGRLAAEVAYCGDAGGRGSAVHAALYRSAADWGATVVEGLPLMLAAAASAGLAADSIAACVTDGRAGSRLQRDRDLANALAIAAVPTVFLDGARLEFRSYAALLDHVARAIRAAARSTAAS